uniref:PiggyBac transposable element-derived protein domain-containing protein n=1 Tax=Octopus bimaculoides TaxID=37653 RepID=A0A0L8G088_OCTBM
MDRYYNSVTLINFLLTCEKSFTDGTAMTVRKLYPKELCKKKLKIYGESDYLCQGSFVCMVWNDHRPIHFISNCHDPTKTVTVSCINKDRSQQNVQVLILVKDYNIYLGISEEGSTNHLCVVCSYKHNKFKRKNANVGYKDYPVKAVKSSVCCSEYKHHLCIKQGSTC